MQRGYMFCFSSYWVLIFDSTLKTRKIDKSLAKFFQSFISPRKITAAQIGFLLLKALYLTFQMPVKLIIESSLKKTSS